MAEHHLPLTQEAVENVKLEASIVSPTEAANVTSLAILISQTINSEYGKFIPQKTKVVNFDLGKRVIVTDDLTTFDKSWTPNASTPLTPQEVNGISFQDGGLIVIENPERDWGRCCPHCKAKDIEILGSEPKARELYKGRYYTTFIAHEEVHQYQDWTLPDEFKETGAYYYTSILARKLGHNPIGDELAAKRYNAYEALLNKYGDDVHKVFFGSAENIRTKLKKPLILREIQKQIDILFPSGQDL